MRIVLRTIALLLLISSTDGYSQDRTTAKDSITLTTLAQDFFNWYILSTSHNMHAAYEPVYVKASNGMTTLDYSTYISNLKKHSFSDSLLEKEKLSYQTCIDHLATVPYSEFIKFSDLADFETRNCDFTNYYRWTGGQETVEGYTVTSVVVNKQHAVVNGFLFDNRYEANGIKGYERALQITFKTQHNKWKISGITY